MADRFPLIANSSANQIQELAASDNLNITSSLIVSSGIVTVSAPVDISKDIIVGAAATIAGVVDLNSTTDSTSSTTGALQIAGGVGIAKNVYIGAGLSVAGTLTYEDVTNVDSVGLITAKSGVNVTGGQLQVGVAYSVGAAGVCTAAGFVGDLTGTVTGSGANLSAGTVPLTSLDLDGGTDIGAGLADADLFIVDDGAGGTNRKTAASRIKTYVADLTLTTAAQTNITSVGSLSALTVTGDLTFDNGTNAGKDILWDVSGNSLIFSDDVKAFFGTSSDGLELYHDGSHSYVTQSGTGNLYIRPKTGEDGITLVSDGAITIAYDNSTKIATTNDGVNITGVGTFTQGLNLTGMLKESCNIVANKLSAGTNIDLEDGMVHYYSTNETTTATPNIRWNSSYSLNSKMNTGDAVTVTIITKPNGAGYYAALNVDGSGVTEEWSGGSAPSSAESGGYDVLTHTLVKTANATFLCLSNTTNFA